MRACTPGVRPAGAVLGEYAAPMMVLRLGRYAIPVLHGIRGEEQDPV